MLAVSLVKIMISLNSILPVLQDCDLLFITYLCICQDKIMIPSYYYTCSANVFLSLEGYSKLLLKFLVTFFPKGVLLYPPKGRL